MSRALLNLPATLAKSHRLAVFQPVDTVTRHAVSAVKPATKPGMRELTLQDSTKAIFEHTFANREEASKLLRTKAPKDLEVVRIGSSGRSTSCALLVPRNKSDQQILAEYRNSAAYKQGQASAPQSRAAQWSGLQDSQATPIPRGPKAPKSTVRDKFGAYIRGDDICEDTDDD